MKKEYVKNYLGIVVQNNDPLKRGRVKVWVPHVDMSVYDKWNETQKNKQFNFPGINVFSDLTTDILNQLKECLPWAEQAMPIVGSGASSGFYNAAMDRGTISNKADYLTEGNDFVEKIHNKEKDEAKAIVGEWKDLKKEQLKKLTKSDGQPSNKGKKGPEPEDDKNVLGVKPAQLYQEKPLNDMFLESGDGIPIKASNPYSKLYRPMPYTNAPQGSFSIPNVGAHVWLFFENGDPLKPVIFAVSYGTEDWKNIYDSHEHDKDDKDTKGPSPDYPGKFENGLNKNDKDYKKTNDDLIYRGKYVLNQRAGSLTFVNTYDREILNLTHFSGSFKEFNNYCNVELAAHNDQKLVLGHQFNTVIGNRSEYVVGDFDSIILGNSNIKYGNPRAMKEPLAQIKAKFEKFHNIYNLPFEIKRSEIAEFGGKNGSETKCPTCQGNGFIALLNIADKILPPYHECDCAHELGLIPNTHTYLTVNVPTAECLTCFGTGISPSTQDGLWNPNPVKDQMATALLNLQKDVFDLEAQLGKGGDVVINYGKNLFTSIGSEMHDFKSYRLDPKGKLVPAGVKISSETAYQRLAATPLVEKVHVDIPPTGSHTLSIGYKYNILVGSGGITFKTTGTVEIGGSSVTVAGKQVVISSDNEVYIDGGSRTHITGDVISLVPNLKDNYAQVFIGGNLEVDRNTIVRGGAYIEGELYTHHITAPREYQKTEKEVLGGHIVNNVIIGKLKAGVVIGKDLSGGDIVSINSAPVILGVCTDDELQILTEPHDHVFANLPLSLFDESKKVREDAIPLNKAEPKLAKPAVYHADPATKMNDMPPEWTITGDPIQSTNNSDSDLDRQLEADITSPSDYPAEEKPQKCVTITN